MKSALSAAILFLFGVALTTLGLSDRLGLYVRLSSRRWVLTAGVAVLALSIWSLTQFWRHRHVEDLPANQPEGHDHGHEHDGPARSSWLVLAPVLVVLAIAPPALGSYTASRAAPIDPHTRHAVLPASTGDLDLLNFYLLANDNPQQLTGKTVGLIGFVEKPVAGGFVLARLVITCCAADAFAVRVQIATPTAVPATGTWVHVQGEFAGMTDETPRLTSATISRIPAPANPYG